MYITYSNLNKAIWNQNKYSCDYIWEVREAVDVSEDFIHVFRRLVEGPKIFDKLIFGSFHKAELEATRDNFFFALRQLIPLLRLFVLKGREITPGQPFLSAIPLGQRFSLGSWELRYYRNYFLCTSLLKSIHIPIRVNSLFFNWVSSLATINSTALLISRTRYKQKKNFIYSELHLGNHTQIT